MAGQELPEPPPPTKSKLGIEWRLLEVEQRAGGAATGAALRAELADLLLRVDDADRVHVELLAPEGTPGVTTAFVESFGGRVEDAYRHLVDAWLPAARLSEVARALPPGVRVEGVYPLPRDDVAGEGPMVMNSDSSDERFKESGCWREASTRSWS